MKDLNLLRRYREIKSDIRLLCEKVDNLEQVCDYLEYKYFKNNIALNKMIYEQELEINRLKGNVKKDFNPLVSIIIPVYNGSNYLSTAIDCALAQDYKNIEIIVVNDGSTEKETEKVALSYKNKIKYYHKENGGVSSALNYGIKKMKGDYFVWLSHDDLMTPDNVSTHINYLRNTTEKNIITYTNFDIINENGNLLIHDTIVASISCYDYKITKTKHYDPVLQGEINGGSVMIPKEAFEEFGMFDEKERIAQEKDMWARMMKKYKFINIPYFTTSIRFHSKQVTNTNNNIRIETDRKLKEIIQNITEEEMIKEYGSVENFYLYTAAHYKVNRIPSMYEYLMKCYEKEKNKKNRKK